MEKLCQGKAPKRRTAIFAVKIRRVSMRIRIPGPRAPPPAFPPGKKGDTASMVV
jgi:hypothetical protein